MYWFKRKYRQIKRVIDFLPILWKGYDFDYGYAIELFKHQLIRTANYLESDKAWTTSAKTNAQKVRTAIRLMDIVYNDYNEDYTYEKQKRAHKLLWDFIEHNIQWWWD